MRFESPLTLWVSNIPPKQVGVHTSKGRRDARIESLRSFHLDFIDEFAVSGRPFDAAAFEARVNEGNARFPQTIADEEFTARRSVINHLAAQFKADAAHLQSKASRGKVTPALIIEMKKDTNKIYDHALGRVLSRPRVFYQAVIGITLKFQRKP